MFFFEIDTWNIIKINSTKLHYKNVWMKRKHKAQLIFELIMHDVIFPRKVKYKKRSNMDKTGISLELVSYHSRHLFCFSQCKD